MWESAVTVISVFNSMSRKAVLFGMATLFAACVGPTRSPPVAQKPRADLPAPPRSTPTQPKPTPIIVRPTPLSPELGEAIRSAWQQFPGKTGIAVLAIDGGGIAGREQAMSFHSKAFQNYGWR